MFLEIGPVSVVIQGEKDGRRYEFEKEPLARKINDILKEIADFLPILRQKAYKIKNTKHVPEVPRRMIEAVRAVDEVSLTPMAAVAGAVADSVKKFLKDEGPDLISVNNGGDISIFNGTGRRFNIQIGDISTGRSLPCILSVERLEDYGIATSGFGGRSLTLGVADVVTVIAETGAMADAAATHICNCTSIVSDNVVRRKASEVDPLTDIPDDYVTTIIGQLNEDAITIALENGLTIAYNMIKYRNIYDAVIVLQGHTVTTINGDNPIKLEVCDGN